VNAICLHSVLKLTLVEHFVTIVIKNAKSAGETTETILATLQEFPADDGNDITAFLGRTSDGKEPEQTIRELLQSDLPSATTIVAVEQGINGKLVVGTVQLVKNDLKGVSGQHLIVRGIDDTKALKHAAGTSMGLSVASFQVNLGAKQHLQAIDVLVRNSRRALEESLLKGHFKTLWTGEIYKPKDQK
jgi:hypothetical protein